MYIIPQFKQGVETPPRFCKRKWIVAMNDFHQRAGLRAAVELLLSLED